MEILKEPKGQVARPKEQSLSVAFAGVQKACSNSSNITTSFNSKFFDQGDIRSTTMNDKIISLGFCSDYADGIIVELKRGSASFTSKSLSHTVCVGKRNGQEAKDHLSRQYMLCAAEWSAWDK